MPKRGDPGNAFGLGEAVVGLIGGFALDIVAVTIYVSVAHLPVSGKGSTSMPLGETITSLLALWTGFIGGVLAASRANVTGWRMVARSDAPPADGPVDGPADGSADRLADNPPRRHSAGSLAADFGLRIKPWPDIPLGVVIGVASQYLLVPLLELPLVPFVSHLNQKLGQPAQQLTSGVGGLELAVLGVFICLGSPFVEELFFRGLLLRALLGRLGGMGSVARPTLAILVTAVIFALVHFEKLQFLGLAGFGAVLCVLAWKTGRLGPGIVAHASFNAVTVLAIALSR